MISENGFFLSKFVFDMKNYFLVSKMEYLISRNRIFGIKNFEFTREYLLFYSGKFDFLILKNRVFDIKKITFLDIKNLIFRYQNMNL